MELRARSRKCSAISYRPSAISELTSDLRPLISNHFVVSMDKRPVVLVTGAAGFIGSHVTDHCLKLGFDVVATDNLSGGWLENVPEEADWVAGDLRDPGFVSMLFAGRRFD